MHGIRLHTTCPAVQALIPFLDAILGSHRVIGERGRLGGHRGLDEWMQGPGAGLRKVPDIVLKDFDGPFTLSLIDVKTFDPAGPIATLTLTTPTTTVPVVTQQRRMVRAK